MKQVIRRHFFGFAIIASALALAACHKAPPPAKGPHPLTPYQRTLVSEIRSSGASVVKQAEVLEIVMPTDRFFRSQTTHLKSRKIGAVNRIASLVKSYASFYRRPRISVTGYTDTVFSRQTRKKISLEYAREVAAYLWDKGISHRWVRVRGYGAKQPIASNKTVKGSAYNRRVVIRIN